VSQFIDQGPHVVGQRTDEMDVLSSNGMDEAKFRGMKRLSGKTESLENRANR